MVNSGLQPDPEDRDPDQASFSFGRGLPNTLDLDFGTLSLVLLITAGFFALNSWLFARRVEL